jgi:hypothetical protein
MRVYVKEKISVASHTVLAGTEEYNYVVCGFYKASLAYPRFLSYYAMNQ